MTSANSEVLLQMIGCKILRFKVTSLVDILTICLGSSPYQTDEVFRNTSTFTNFASCFLYLQKNKKKHRMFVCGLFANWKETQTKFFCKKFMSPMHHATQMHRDADVVPRTLNLGTRWKCMVSFGRFIHEKNSDTHWAED